MQGRRHAHDCSRLGICCQLPKALDKKSHGFRSKVTSLFDEVLDTIEAYGGKGWELGNNGRSGFGCQLAKPLHQKIYSLYV